MPKRKYKEPDEPKPPQFDLITATEEVSRKGSRTYWEHCRRCNGHPIVKGTYVPLTPIFSSRDMDAVIGIAGGILPVFIDGQPDQIAACDCTIGYERQQQHHLRFYDSINGTNTEDTKHSLIMAEYQRRIAKPPEDSVEVPGPQQAPDPSGFKSAPRVTGLGVTWTEDQDGNIIDDLDQPPEDSIKASAPLDSGRGLGFSGGPNPKAKP